MALAKTGQARRFGNGRAGGRGFSGRAARMAMLGLGLGLAASGAIPASAQDFYTFEGHNRVRYWERDMALGLVSAWAQQAHVAATSQPFTLDTDFLGYRIQGVRAGIDFRDGIPMRSHIAVYLFSDKDGLPRRQITRLDLVGSPRDGTREFRPRQVMGQDPILLPGTTYHIVFARGINHEGNRSGPGYRLGLIGERNRTKNDYTLAFNSFGLIYPSLFNQSLRIRKGSRDASEYGDNLDITYTRGNLEISEFLEGFPVTYGWNRMTQLDGGTGALGLQILGAPITDMTPVFTLAPRPVSATAPATGARIDIVLDNVPADAAGRTPPTERFAVMADNMVVPVGGVAVSAADRRVRLTLSRTIKQGQTVRVTYTDQTDGDDTAVLQSPAGVDAPRFLGYAVTNNSTVPDPSPKPVSATIPAAGNRLDVVFNHAPDGGAGRTPAKEQFAVAADGVPVMISGISVSAANKRVRLTLATTVKVD